MDLSRFRVRKLTPTEYDRLQAFPMDNWEQVVSDSQAYKQFGNAVTVSVVSAIAKQLKGCLEGERSEAGPGKEETAEATEQEADNIRPLAAYTDTELLEELMRRRVANA